MSIYYCKRQKVLTGPMACCGECERVELQAGQQAVVYMPAPAPLVSAEERKQIRKRHTPAKCIHDQGGEQWPCVIVRLLDAIEAAEQTLVQTGIGELNYQASVDRYNAHVTTNAAGEAPVYFEMPHDPKGFHPSVPRLGIYCACEQCKAEREAKP